MKKLLLAALAVIFVSVPVMAQDMPTYVPSVDRNGAPLFIKNLYGERISMTSTTDIVDFGFTSDYVTVCVEGDATALVYFRFSRAGVTAGATSSALFISGAGGTSATGRAGVIVSPSIGRAFPATAVNAAFTSRDICQTHAWAIGGIEFHVETAMTATLSVNAYGH